MKKKFFKKVLVANRGEIAVRVMRTLREMGISPVAIYSEADRIAPHVRWADQAYCVGAPPSSESYLRYEKVLEIAKVAKVDAIHPGYGFLSENGAFVEAVSEAGIEFIGPSAKAMRVMGSKIAARDAMEAAGVPCVPGSDGPIQTETDALKIAEEIGYPVMLKASAGGGGKGMRLVEDSSQLSGAFRGASSEAANAFGDATVYLEKAIVQPRHIEIQILGGPDGKSIWLGERECSMQRRHQKVIEETPSVLVDGDLLKRMGEVACRAADAVSYVGAGTVEFLVDRERKFYFLEMNTRLQVEHPVTELCCGIDLVESQVQVAQGEALPWTQDEISRRGHAIEARIYAEDPKQNFMPSPGLIQELVLPNWPGLRVDCGVTQGYEVSMFYDPMIAKVIAWGRDREQARTRLSGALQQTAVKGITTNTAFLRGLLESDSFIRGEYHTGSIAEIMSAQDETPANYQRVAVIAAALNRYRRERSAATRIIGDDARSDSQTGWKARTWRRGGF